MKFNTYLPLNIAAVFILILLGLTLSAPSTDKTANAERKMRQIIRQEMAAEKWHTECERECDLEDGFTAIESCIQRCYIGWKNSVGEE